MLVCWYVGMLVCWYFGLLDPVGDFGRIGRGGSGRGVGYGTGPVHPLAPQGGARLSRGTLGAVEVHIPHFPVECGSAVSELAHRGAADLA